MPTLSIITAVHAPNSAHLDKTAAGVQHQRLPAGWTVEWIVQEDDATPILAGVFADLPYARYAANGFQLGIAATRNFGLARATGDLVQVLDSDDVLLPGASAALIEVFADADVCWAVGQADDLLPDGTRLTWQSALPYGRVAPGVVNRWAEDRGGNWPIHCAGLMMRASALRALGGWIGLPTDEDIAMIAALSEISAGHNLDRVTWLYRRHAGQITRSEGTGHASEQARRFALQRARAVRVTGLSFSGYPVPGFANDGGHDVAVRPAFKSPQLGRAADGG